MFNRYKRVRRVFMLASLAPIAILGTGCGTMYLSQAPVSPESDNIIVVGHDSGPYKRIWVLEGNESYDVTYEEAD